MYSLVRMMKMTFSLCGLPPKLNTSYLTILKTSDKNVLEHMGLCSHTSHAELGL